MGGWVKKKIKINKFEVSSRTVLMCFSTREAMEAAAAESYEPISCASMVSEEMIGFEF